MASAFLAPVFFAFLALIPAVVLLYLLKLRRTEVIIPSTFLWRKSLQDITANAPFQKLRKNLLLFLQILILILLTIALARPFVKAMGYSGSQLCLLIDRSASMQTIEEGSTRLEQAKEVAHGMVNDMRGGDKMMIVTFSENADVICELTEDKFRLREAIDSIAPSDTRTKVRDAIMVVSSLKASIADLQPFIVSDGKVADIEQLGSRVTDVEYITIGENHDNAGIVAFSVRAPSEGQAQRQSFVAIHNESEKALQSTLSLYFDDQLLTIEEVSVEAGQKDEVVFSHPDLGRGILRAELDHEDVLAADNVAWLALQPPATIRVLLVSEADSANAFFLQRVLTLDERVELSTLSPEDFAPTEEYDLCIFDATAPEQLPSGTLLFLNSLPEMEGLVSAGEIKSPPVLSKDPEHPVMRFLNPSNVGIRKAMQVELPEGSRSLLSTRGGPLIADISRGGQQRLLVTFDIAESNWPLRLSFPLFFQNILAWVPRTGMQEETSTQAGQPFSIPPSSDVEQAIVVAPDGSEQKIPLDPLRPVYFGATEQTGVYDVAFGEETLHYAVNLLDPMETSVKPSDTLKLGRAEVAGERGIVQQNKELWRYFIFAGLFILGLEWWIYSRRAWI